MQRLRHEPEDDDRALPDGAVLGRPCGCDASMPSCSPCRAGLVPGALGRWPILAGGVPSARTALVELWHDQRLDIDLLMVVAALAAAAVGAALEGAVLLALFSLSQTLEHRAMGKARRAVEALMQLRPETALREGPDGVTEVAGRRPGAR